MDVGKHFPITEKCFVDYWHVVPQNWGKTFPRRLRFGAVDYPAIGTIAVLWQNIDVVSEIAEYAPDSTKALQYRFNHPTVETTYATLRLEFFQNAFGSTGLNYQLKFYDGADIVTWRNAGFSAGYVFGIWPQPPYNWNWGPFWDNQPFPDRWEQMRCYMGAGLWSDSPEFKPYKTRDE